MSDLKKVYKVGENGRGRPIIVIRRKPSDTPWQIEHRMGELGCITYMDGPNNRMTYEFLLHYNVVKAEEYLKWLGWEKEGEVEKTFSITDAYGGHGPSILVPSYIGVSDVVRDRLNSLSAWGGNTANSPDYMLWEFPISKDVNFVEAYNLLKQAGYKRTGSLLGEEVVNEVG